MAKILGIIIVAGVVWVLWLSARWEEQIKEERRLR